MNLEERIHLYAQVILKAGIELKQGQPVCIEASREIEDFIAVMAEEIRRAGGGKTLIVLRENNIDMEVLEKAAMDGAGFIKLETPSLDEKDPMDPVFYARKKQEMTIRNLFRSRAWGCGQTVACVPCQGWADLVFPGHPENQRLSSLWEKVFSCTYCDTKNPLERWRGYIRNTMDRKKLLNRKHYEEFHYIGENTDLTIKPALEDVWKGGCIVTPDRVCIPNIPTQEVFLTPHKYSANGRITATMPVNYGGRLIEGIQLSFENGRIVDFYAAKNQKLLEAIIETDEGSHYLGEMALVDQENPIAQMGLLFYTTLYDENAACHLAIGNAIGPDARPSDNEKRGINRSSVHVDFMVGSRELTIHGKRPDGVWEDVFRNGRPVL